MQNASLPRGHASIRIQQYVGIITCMGLVLLRANEIDREDCTCGEESSTWESRLVTLINDISGYIDIFVFSIIYCIGEKIWALHGEQWVYEQVKIVSSRRCVNHIVRLHLLEGEVHHTAICY